MLFLWTGPKAPIIDQQPTTTSNSITITWTPGTNSQQVISQNLF